MKYLGIDYGTKRIGIAISDDDGSFAFPKTIILNSPEAIKRIATLIIDDAIQGVVIGQSIASNEAINDTQALVQQFAKKLQMQTDVVLYFEREDFSTVEAHRYQTTAGNRDDSAAAIILQRFLDKRKK